MSDMPPPHALPEYAKPSNKIKIRPRQASQPVASGSSHAAPKQEQSGTSSFLLRVPAAQKAAAQVQTASPMPVPSIPVPTTKKQALASVPVTKAPAPQISAPSKVPTPQPNVQTVSFINATPSHYPRAPYNPPAPAAASPAPVAATPPILPLTGNASSASHSPTPVVLPLNRQLKSITLRMQPKGRSLTLDHCDGVKNWAVRLGPGETSILVSNVSYLGDEEEEESSADEGDGEKHEEDDDMDVDVDVDVSPPSKNGRRRNKPRGRGRPPKAATIAAKAAAAAKAAKAEKKKAISKVGEIQLKLNNFVVKEQPEEHGEWSVQLPAGPNIIEVGEVGGMVWKVYAERLGDV
jgi:chromatin structure-remodeling complex subunit RSC4